MHISSSPDRADLTPRVINALANALRPSEIHALLDEFLTHHPPTSDIALRILDNIPSTRLHRRLPKVVREGEW